MKEGEEREEEKEGEEEEIGAGVEGIVATEVNVYETEELASAAKDQIANEQARKAQAAKDQAAKVKI